MPTASKPKRTSPRFNAEEIAAAKLAARGRPKVEEPAIDWGRAVVTSGGGVTTTIGEIRRSRGPNKNPTKEQVAIRLDRDVLVAFRAGGPGWQTRMNDALKDWLVTHKSKRTTRQRS